MPPPDGFCDYSRHSKDGKLEFVLSGLPFKPNLLSFKFFSGYLGSLTCDVIREPLHDVEIRNLTTLSIAGNNAGEYKLAESDRFSCTYTLVPFGFFTRITSGQVSHVTSL